MITGRSRSNTRTSASMYKYRHLIWNFTQRDLKSKFQGTSLGWAWSLIVPLATVIIYTVVFGVVFRAQPPAFGNGREGIFAVWFFAGLVPWGIFSASATGGMPSLLSTGPLLQKIYIPSYVPVLGAVGAIFIQGLIEFGILGALLAGFGDVGWTWLAFPLWLLLFIGFCAGFAVILAIFNVYFRDLGQITTVLLQLMFFMCPIIYTVDFIPVDFHGIPLRTILTANPIAQFIITLREILYEAHLPSLSQLLYLAAWTAVMLGIAVLVFRRWGRDVGEEM